MHEKEKNLRYYINIVPPSPIIERFRSLEQTWQGESASPPHLTLIYPHVLSPEKEEADLIAAIQNTVCTRSSFPVHLLQIGSFREKENIHVCVERTAELVLCQQELARATQTLFMTTTRMFVHLEHPHISIANHIPQSERTHVWANLLQETFGETFLCKHIHLVKRGPEDRVWIPVFTFPLL